MNIFENYKHCVRKMNRNKKLLGGFIILFSSFFQT